MDSHPHIFVYSISMCLRRCWDHVRRTILSFWLWRRGKYGLEEISWCVGENFIHPNQVFCEATHSLEDFQRVNIKVNVV
jgi:hypothetical protein